MVAFNRLALTRMKAVLIVVVVVVAVIAGYYTYVQTAPPPPLQTVRIARQAPDTPSLMYLAVAKRTGVFAQNGVNASLLDLPGPPQVMQALLAGDADIGDASSIIALGGLTQSANIKVVAITSVVWNFIIVAKTKYNSLADLKGATLAIAGPGVGDDIILDKALQTVGLSLKDTQVVSVGISPRKFEAVTTGRADATALVTEYIPRVQARQDVKILDDKAGRYLPFLPFHFIMARTDFIQKNPQLVRAVVKSIIQTLRQLQTDQQFFTDQVTGIFPKDYSADDAKVFFANLRDIGYWGVNGGISLANLDKLVGLYYNEINPKASRDIIKKGSDLVDTRFLVDVINQLGPVSATWDTPDWR